VKGAEERDEGVMMCRGAGGGSYDSKGSDPALENRVIWVREGKSIRWGSMSIVLGMAIGYLEAWVTLLASVWVGVMPYWVFLEPFVVSY
jgi:hypothetical protein